MYLPDEMVLMMLGCVASSIEVAERIAKQRDRFAEAAQESIESMRDAIGVINEQRKLIKELMEREKSKEA